MMQGRPGVCWSTGLQFQRDWLVYLHSTRLTVPPVSSLCAKLSYSPLRHESVIYLLLNKHMNV